MQIKPHIPRLHVITDTTLQQRWDHFTLAKRAWDAGDVAVQYRQKDFDHARDSGELFQIAAAARQMGKCLIVNDSVELAIANGASGVHLGKGDGAVAVAITLMGPSKIVGATVHDMEELKALERLEVSYIGVGPVFGTRSKSTGLPDLGLNGLEEICGASPWPVIAIGGIGLEQVSACMNAGAYGVATLGAFCTARYPEGFAREMLEKILESC